VEWKIAFLAARFSCAEWWGFWCYFEISYASFTEQHD